MRGAMTVAATLVAALALSGCSLIPGLDDSYLIDDPDDFTYPEPSSIAFVDGSASLTLTGGTTAAVELPLMDGSSSDIYTTSVGFRDSDFAVAVNGFSSDGTDAFESWSVMVHRFVPGGHWMTDWTSRCEADADIQGTSLTGSATRRRQRWIDAVTMMTVADYSGTRIDGEDPFDLELTFQATLAGPLPTRDPSATQGPFVVDLGQPEEGPRIHAAHILYSPGDDPSFAYDLEDDESAWEAPRLEAQAAADDLRAIADPDARIAAFALRAAESDDPLTAHEGGDLGWFSRDTMVPEFADPVFDAVDPQRGDIIGPARSAFGWHVILFYEAEDAPADDPQTAPTDDPQTAPTDDVVDAVDAE